MTDYGALNECELVQLFIAGDDQAFREIYVRYDKPLFLYAYHKLGNKEESRDVVQDVFVWMLHHRTKFEVGTTLSGYLYKSVLNRIYNIFKHKGIQIRYAEHQPFHDLSAQQSDYLIREKDIRYMIDKTIAAMPDRMREIYQLRSTKYMSARQISEYLGIAESTVTTQLKRAMKQLRVNLSRAGNYFSLFF